MKIIRIIRVGNSKFEIEEDVPDRSRDDGSSFSFIGVVTLVLPLLMFLMQEMSRL